TFPVRVTPPEVPTDRVSLPLSLTVPRLAGSVSPEPPRVAMELDAKVRLAMLRDEPVPPVRVADRLPARATGAVMVSAAVFPGATTTTAAGPALSRVRVPPPAANV